MVSGCELDTPDLLTVLPSQTNHDYPECGHHHPAVIAFMRASSSCYGRLPQELRHGDLDEGTSCDRACLGGPSISLADSFIV